MGDVLVENPANMALPHKRQSPANSIPAIDSLEGIGNDETDEYSTLKKLQRHLEYAFAMSNRERTADRRSDTSTFKKSTSRMNRGGYLSHRLDPITRLKTLRSLKRELVRAQEEIKRIQSVPLVIGQFMEAIDQK